MEDLLLSLISRNCVLKFAALVFMSTVGVFFIFSASYHPWNVNGENTIGGSRQLYAGSKCPRGKIRPQLVGQWHLDSSQGFGKLSGPRSLKRFQQTR